MRETTISALSVYGLALLEGNLLQSLGVKFDLPEYEECDPYVLVCVLSYTVSQRHVTHRMSRLVKLWKGRTPGGHRR